ncbi:MULTISPECIES: hypothetical protein [unclassified Actinoplanes]|uniref:hypothetical protein n=1 Tax=unclassified Actinoplanes TaxID=2626549 RepID=UPI0005B9697B|nr:MULTISPECIES: hypothetical protein [unclassified Actinoplanes]
MVDHGTSTSGSRSARSPSWTGVFVPTTGQRPPAAAEPRRRRRSRPDEVADECGGVPDVIDFEKEFDRR